MEFGDKDWEVGTRWGSRSMAHARLAAHQFIGKYVSPFPVSILDMDHVGPCRQH